MMRNITSAKQASLGKRVATYVGGQMEVQNEAERYLYRGEIEKIGIENNTLKVRFAWLKKLEGFPDKPGKWVEDKNLDYSASLEIYHPSDIGEGRLSFYSQMVNELAVLFPKGGSKLLRD